MSDRSKIEWTEASWNPIAGCSVVSPGCTNCYAMHQAGGRLRSTAKFAELTRPSKAGPVWTGEMRFWEKALEQPLRWKEPRRIFVNSMSDLFHEALPHSAIRRVFDTMRDAPQHIYQILTKRADRMQQFVDWWVRQYVDRPPMNWWLGVSVEDQQRANERIPLLLDTLAAVRWVSAEPLLGPIDFTRFDDRASGTGAHARWRNALDGTVAVDWPGVIDTPLTGRTKLSWIVIGGESGPRARSMDLDWARSLVKDCQNAGTACFVKQLGTNPTLHGFTGMPLRDRKGGDPAEWPEDLRVREYPR